MEFEGQNKVFAADQDCYGNLPSHQSDDDNGFVTACWSMSWRERLAVFWNGCVWCQVLTYGQRLQPTKVSAQKPQLAGEKDDE